MFSNEQDAGARLAFLSCLGWFAVGVFFALLVAIKFVFPDFLAGYGPLQFGRLRPAHVNTVFFGWLSMALIGGMLYILPRLTRNVLYSEKLAQVAVWLLNFTVFVGIVTLLNGMTQAREYAELIWPLDILMAAVFVLLIYNALRTVLIRVEPTLYVSIWYFLGSVMWTLLVYGIGNVIWVTPWNAPPGAPWGGTLTGINDVILNWFYGHNVLGLWFTTMGVGMAYYLLPAISRNPLYSHRLSMIGFWTIAFTYPMVGQHHIIFGPGPDWLESVSIIFSLMLLIPVFTVIYNFFKTMAGKWHLMTEAGTNLPARFLVVGGISYLLTCIQGPAQALRTMNRYLHFTNWVVGHAHLALLGGFSFWSMAMIYYALPRIAKREIFSERLVLWHFWLTVVGLMGFMQSLWIAGLVQGSHWVLGGVVPFLETVKILWPYYFVRMVSAFLMVAGQWIFVYNMYQTVRKGKPVEVVEPAPELALAS